jgi:hypothetical protein
LEDEEDSLSKKFGFLKKEDFLSSSVNVRKGDLILMVQQGRKKIKQEEEEKEKMEIIFNEECDNGFLYEIFPEVNMQRKDKFKLGIARREMEYHNDADIKIIPIGFIDNMLGQYYLSKAGNLLLKFFFIKNNKKK